MNRLPADLVLRTISDADAAGCAAVTTATDRTYLEWMPEEWQPAGEDSERDHYREILAEPGRWSLGAFDPAGRMVGFASLRAAEDEAGAPIEGHGHLGHLFVHPDRWREGIAAALLASAEEEMRGRGYARGSLWTPVGAPAIDFYRRMGWSETGERRHLERHGLEAIGFSKSFAREGA